MELVTLYTAYIDYEYNSDRDKNYFVRVGKIEVEEKAKTYKKITSDKAGTCLSLIPKNLVGKIRYDYTKNIAIAFTEEEALNLIKDDILNQKRIETLKYNETMREFNQALDSLE